jgi:hypothetical protein
MSTEIEWAVNLIVKEETRCIGVYESLDEANFLAFRLQKTRKTKTPFTVEVVEFDRASLPQMNSRPLNASEWVK